MPRADGIDFTVSPSPRSARVGEAVNVRLQLRNTAAEPRVVSMHCRPGAEVVLRLERDGKAVPPADMVHGALGRGGFCRLKPGQSLICAIDLSLLFALSEAGSYQLSARYRSERLALGRALGLLFLGETEAEPVTFQLNGAELP